MNDTLAALNALLDAQFEEVCRRYGLPAEYRPKSASQTEHAIVLLRYAEQHPDGVPRLNRVIAQVRNPRPGFRSQRGLWIALWVLVAVAVLFALWHHHEHRQQVAETRRLKEQVFDRPPLLPAWQKLTRVWMPQHPHIERLQGRPQQWREYVELVVHHNHLEAEIDLLVDFYQDLYLCLQHRQCDVQTAGDYFGADAARFYRLHKPWIAARRAVVPDYAVALQAFVEE